VFAGDNGPEEVLLWRGSPGYWEGSYFAGGEGDLRTPCMIRWPGQIAPGRTSNEIMHVTDWFTTLLHAAGVSPPTDRVIDGIDQLDWLSGRRDSSARERLIFWMGPEMYGAKWHDVKLVLVIQKYLTDPALRAWDGVLLPDKFNSAARLRGRLTPWCSSTWSEAIAGFRNHEPPATSSAETRATVASALGRRPAQAAVPAAPLVGHGLRADHVTLSRAKR
jgi:hypothetical protein